ncbi:WLM domain-containing protein [Colletotrichum lupini]|uniref:WLM domain-containing protein n=1 Tax=Colletotrichum lupini TaxID=145971 RepID=A0A9Q8T5F2_9PEZI|nr:WLM domain-containing protein [Colletotrichum lupini]UQC88481.1 WLM domain-containing protein [Colletotrichum lupini]
MPEQDALILSFSHLPDFPRAPDALQTLKKVASLVKPIMRVRGWKVRELAEFYPDQANLLGQRLGGSGPSIGSDIRRTIVGAIERRNTTLQGCGNTNHNDREIQQISETATKNGFRTQAEEDAANEAAIAQALWELVQEEERQRTRNETSIDTKARDSATSCVCAGAPTSSATGLDMRSTLTWLTTYKQSKRRGIESLCGSHTGGMHPAHVKTKMRHDMESFSGTNELPSSYTRATLLLSRYEVERRLVAF